MLRWHSFRNGLGPPHLLFHPIDCCCLSWAACILLETSATVFYFQFVSTLLPFGFCCRTKMTRERLSLPSLRKLSFLLWGDHFPPAQRSLGWDHFHFLFLQLIGGDHPMVGGRFLTPVQTTVFTNRCPFPDSQGQPCTWCGCWDMIT